MSASLRLAPLRPVLLGLSVLLVALVLPAQVGAQPNILLIQTDDQRRVGTMEYMPETRRLFSAQGTVFTSAFATTPLCCPSRATTYSGRYVHNHGITGNDGTGFDHEATWLADLRANGYFVGLLGKYLNGVGARGSAAEFARQWSAHDRHDPRVAAKYARTFLTRAEEQDDRPWALAVNPYSPHVPVGVLPKEIRPIDPYVPKPSFDESDLSDKHPNIQLFRELAWSEREWKIDEVTRQGQILEVQAVDEMVSQIFRDLRNRDEARDTFAIFMSDNGFFWGEHSLTAKERPYDEAVRIPFYARWPGVFEPEAVRKDLVANVDIAPTVYEAAEITPSRVLDGESFLEPTDRMWMFNEGFGPPYDGTSLKGPSWVSYYDGTRRYIRWEDGFIEDYARFSDPYEMDASNEPVALIDEALDAAAGCSGEACP